MGTSETTAPVENGARMIPPVTEGLVHMRVGGPPALSARIVSDAGAEGPEPCSDSRDRGRVRLAGAKTYAVDGRDAVKAEVIEDDGVGRQADDGYDDTLELPDLRGGNAALEDRKVDAIAVGLEIVGQAQSASVADDVVCHDDEPGLHGRSPLEVVSVVGGSGAEEDIAQEARLRYDDFREGC